MNIDDLLDLMDETIEDAFTVPLTGKRMVDADRLRDIIDDIRLNMPGEIRQARGIVQDRNDILENAKKEAEKIITKAEEQQKILISDTEVVKISKEKAVEIISNAKKESKEITRNTTSYCDKILRQTEEQMSKTCDEVHRLRVSIKNKDKK